VTRPDRVLAPFVDRSADVLLSLARALRAHLLALLCAYGTRGILTETQTVCYGKAMLDVEKMMEITHFCSVLTIVLCRRTVCDQG
jgi:hypothetical protein